MDMDDFSTCPICGKVFQGHKGHGISRGMKSAHLLFGNLNV